MEEGHQDLHFALLFDRIKLHFDLLGAQTPMIAQVDPSSLAPLLAGPASAVIVLVLVLWGLYVLAAKHLVPLGAALGKRHLDQIDELIKVQRAEGNAIAKTLTSIDRRLARLESITDAGQFITPNPGALSPDRST